MLNFIMTLGVWCSCHMDATASCNRVFFLTQFMMQVQSSEDMEPRSEVDACTSRSQQQMQVSNAAR